MRFNDQGPIMAQKETATVLVLGGSGKYEGTSGAGTIDWYQGHEDPN